MDSLLLSNAVVKHLPEASLWAGIDVTGGKIEYNINEPLGPRTNHTKSREVAIDEICPQSGEFEIVRFAPTFPASHRPPVDASAP